MSNTVPTNTVDGTRATTNTRSEREGTLTHLIVAVVLERDVIDRQRRVLDLRWRRRSRLRLPDANAADTLAAVHHHRVDVEHDALADPVIGVVAAAHLFAQLDVRHVEHERFFQLVKHQAPLVFRRAFLTDVTLHDVLDRDQLPLADVLLVQVLPAVHLTRFRHASPPADLRFLPASASRTALTSGTCCRRLAAAGSETSLRAGVGESWFAGSRTARTSPRCGACR